MRIFKINFLKIFYFCNKTNFFNATLVFNSNLNDHICLFKKQRLSCIIIQNCAEVAELVDALVSKTNELYVRAGSIPAFGTKLYI